MGNYSTGCEEQPKEKEQHPEKGPGSGDSAHSAKELLRMGKRGDPEFTERMTACLNQAAGEIRPADAEAMQRAKERERSLAKVPGSLGKLENIAVKIAGITGKAHGNPLKRQAILLMSADHGVTAEGVASAPQTVTTCQTVNFTRRITGVGSLAKYFGIDLLVTDLGMRIPAPPEYYTDQMLTENGTVTQKIVNRRIAAGTGNLLKEPAMSREQVLRAVLTGIEAADAAADAGMQLLGVGEMGIGNTTPSSALLCCLTDLPPEELVGRGGGLNDEGLKRKKEVVEEASSRCCREADENLRSFLSAAKGNPVRPLPDFREDARIDAVLELLWQIGGFEIAAMTGAYLGAAGRRIPTVVDGFISAAAALAACEMVPETADYLFASHCSTEPGYLAAVSAMGLQPALDLQMRLGEGSGCPLMFKIMEGACASMDLMGTLEDGQIDSGYLDRMTGHDYTGGAD